MGEKLDEILVAASEQDNEVLFTQILTILRDDNSLISSEETQSGIEFLLESFGESVSKSEKKAKFCIELAKLGLKKSSSLTFALQRAFNKLNSTLLPNSEVIKATGVKNKDVSPQLAVERFNVLENLKKGVRFFSPTGKIMGTVIEVDDLTSEIILSWDASSAKKSPKSLDSALSEFIFFNNNEIFEKASASIFKISSTEWKQILSEIFISEPNDKILEQMALFYAGEQGEALSTFKNWWKGEPLEEKKTFERHPSEARTIQELYTLLSHYEGDKLNDTEIQSVQKFINKLKTNLSEKDSITLAETLVMIQKYIPEEKIKFLCEGKQGKIPFWPSNTSNKTSIKIWNKIGLKTLQPFTELTISCTSEEYMLNLLMNLPLRCWNNIIAAFQENLVFEFIEKQDKISADAILWVWRYVNIAPQGVKEKLHPEAISAAINKGIEDTSTQASKLKELFILNTDFHKFMIELVKGHEIDILHAIQTCDSLRLDEKQSMLVKISTNSPEIKEMLEKGEGKKMFAAHKKQHLKKKEEEEETLTSIKSFKLLTEELSDIVKIQIPENSAAIAHARSYGDLKENSEYKAAKERQAFLQKRRSELEMALNTLIPTDFSDVIINGICTPGSMITVKYDDDSTEIFYLLGVWDSNPDNNFLSSVSRLGKILKNKSVGEKIKMPDSRFAIIEKVEKLPDNIRIPLSEE
jgi:transcription elongation GreA/GreB family factor